MSKASQSFSRIPTALVGVILTLGIASAHAQDANRAERVPELEVRRTFIDHHWAIHAPTADQVTFDLSTGGRGRITRIGLFIQGTWSIDSQGELCLTAEAGSDIGPGTRLCHAFYREGDGYAVAVQGHTPVPVFFVDPQTRLFVDSTNRAGG